jgi:hypothetical protein
MFYGCFQGLARKARKFWSGQSTSTARDAPIGIRLNNWFGVARPTSLCRTSRRRHRTRRSHRVLQPEFRGDEGGGLVAQTGFVGAGAFGRSGAPATADFGDAKLLRKFGDVPDDLSAL